MVDREDEQAKSGSGADGSGTQDNAEQAVRPAGGVTNHVNGAFTPETADREALLARYRDVEERLRQAEDRVLRIAADSENFKKRIERDKQEATRYANERFIAALLPVIDNLERALEHSQGGYPDDGLVQGVKMTLKSFQDTLSRFGCVPIEAEGMFFDPNFHEAVYREESIGHPNNMIVRELQKGYLLNDRLLRPAMVVVACSPSTNADYSSGNTSIKDNNSENSHVRIKVTPA